MPCLENSTSTSASTEPSLQQFIYKWSLKALIIRDSGAESLVTGQAIRAELVVDGAWHLLAHGESATGGGMK